ncbi:class I SAM-dependent methyltransferase [Streptomyces noursei]|uniref:class I SAM-dependent methyltransferase n=1 Tax=Streptomyces noursei TaxID=1971 RepID=UPI000A66ED41
MIRDALAGARTVVGVGAGAGSYEPTDAEVTPVDPSQVMLDRPPGSRKVLAGAEELPFVDGAFDVAMAVVTVMAVHHWPDLRRGPSELRRVARRQVAFTWDPTHLRECEPQHGTDRAAVPASGTPDTPGAIAPVSSS